MNLLKTIIGNALLHVIAPTHEVLERIAVAQERQAEALENIAIDQLAAESYLAGHGDPMGPIRFPADIATIDGAAPLEPNLADADYSAIHDYVHGGDDEGDDD